MGLLSSGSYVDPLFRSLRPTWQKLCLSRPSLRKKLPKIHLRCLTVEPQSDRSCTSEHGPRPRFDPTCRARSPSAAHPRVTHSPTLPLSAPGRRAAQPHHRDRTSCLGRTRVRTGGIVSSSFLLQLNI